MPQNTHVEMADIEAARIAQEKKEPAADFAALRKNAEEVSRCMAWNPSVHASRFFSARWKAMAATLRPVLEKVGRAKRKQPEPDDLRWLRENLHLLWAEVGNTRNAFKQLPPLPAPRDRSLAPFLFREQSLPALYPKRTSRRKLPGLACC